MKLQLRLNANHLKLIAIIAMTIDHICDLIYPCFPAEPGAMVLHIVGRLTAPIMWFFVCEGYYYTHNVKRYTSVCCAICSSIILFCKQGLCFDTDWCFAGLSGAEVVQW